MEVNISGRYGPDLKIHRLLPPAGYLVLTVNMVPPESSYFKTAPPSNVLEPLRLTVPLM